jgi:signal recognition particle subunit SRP19
MSSDTLNQLHSNFDEAKIKRWVIIYPAYIDAKKTLREGRRIPKEKAVENPTLPEIQQVLALLNIEFIVEVFFLFFSMQMFN